MTLGEPKKLKDTLVHVPVTIEIPPGTRPMVHLDTAQGEAARIVFSTTHPKIKELSLAVRFAVETINSRTGIEPVDRRTFWQAEACPT